MKKQELIAEYERVSNFVETVKTKSVIDKLKQLDERQKVTVPQFVADYIDFKKTYDFHVYGAMRVIEDHHDKRVQEWFYEGNIETFVRAWLDGYEVEKEKRYLVKITASDQYLVKATDENFLGFLQSKLRSKFTKKELDSLGFGWVFECPGIEIEEVEDE
jgi:hypothetical protein|nr:MAG TPA: Protein of unknown function (DUF1642) [Caudoviricetes sp.]